MRRATIIVLIAFWMAYSVGANAQAAFFLVDKATREAAGSGTIYALANAARHSIPTWVPMFKFLGLGIMLGAITMALGSIIQTLACSKHPTKDEMQEIANRIRDLSPEI